MKQYNRIPLVLVLLGGLLFSSCQKDLVLKEVTPCADTLVLKNTSICLPEIEGMKNYYGQHKDVTKYADETIPPGNQVLAYYTKIQDIPISQITDLTQLNPIYTIDDNDFFFIYTLADYEQNPVSRQRYQDIRKSFLEMAEQKSRREVIRHLEKKRTTNLYSRPVLIDHYRGPANSRTYLSIHNTKVLIDKKPFIHLVNLALVNDILIVSNYYSIYESPKSIREAKGNMDAIVKALMAM